MQTREHAPHSIEQPSNASGGPSPNAQNLQAAQAAGQRLLSVGSNIISQTLTGQSERFNQAMQQDGGE